MHDGRDLIVPLRVADEFCGVAPKSAIPSAGGRRRGSTHRRRHQGRLGRSRGSTFCAIYEVTLSEASRRRPAARALRQGRRRKAPASMSTRCLADQFANVPSDTQSRSGDAARGRKDRRLLRRGHALRDARNEWSRCCEGHQSREALAGRHSRRRAHPLARPPEWLSLAAARLSRRLCRGYFAALTVWNVFVLRRIRGAGSRAGAALADLGDRSRRAGAARACSPGPRRGRRSMS